MLVESIKYMRRIIEIHLEEETFDMNPRENHDNLGTMVCWHSRYILGDEQPKIAPDSWWESLAMDIDDTVEERILWWEDTGYGRLEREMGYPKAEKKLQQIINKIVDDALEKRLACVLPISLYDHGGITMYIGSGSHAFDPGGWDSGQVGWIYATKKDCYRIFNRQRMSKKLYLRVRKALEDEVNIYDQYLRGEIYGYVVRDPHDDDSWVASAGGYFDKKFMIEDAKHATEAVFGPNLY